MTYPALLFWLLGSAWAIRNTVHPPGDQARDLWQKMLAAKGVKQVPVRNIVISSMAGSGSARFNTNAGRERSTVVASLPDKWWSFDDFRPGKLGYSVTVDDFGAPDGWVAFAGGPAQILDPRGRGQQDRWLRMMAIYLCEAQGFQPTPTKASHSGRYEVVTASWKDYTLIYYLQSSTHLPKKLEIQHIVDFTVPRHGDVPPKSVSKLNTNPFRMEEYHSVQGLQVPARVKLWDGWDRVKVEVNVDLPEHLFDTPPVNVTSADDWKRRTPAEK